MKYRRLGNTDMEVSAICLGTMTWGEQNSETDGHDQLDHAFAEGINFIDTAELYPVPPRSVTQGSTESIVGSWIHQRKNRDKYILATKVTGPSPNLNYIRNPLKFSKAQIRTALEGSLKRLRTGYVDLYQLHWPERKTNFFGRRGYRHEDAQNWKDNFLEILNTMQDFIVEGKIRHFGVSNETPWGLNQFLKLAELHGLPGCVSIQNPYSLLNRLFEVGLSEISIRENVGLLAYSPLAFGLLSGKYHDNSASENSRLNQFKVMSRYNGENSYNATARYVQLARDHGLTPVQMALAYVNQRPFVTSNIIGATSMDQLRENIESIDIILSHEMVREIDKIHEAIPNPAP